MPRVRIILKPNGSVHTDVEGDKGSKCFERTAFLNKVLGPPARTELKEEYYEADDSVCTRDGLPEGHCG